MSEHPPINRRQAERILDAPADSAHPVAEVLNATTAPPRAEELRREDAAVAAFHSARLTPTTRSHDMTKPRSAAARAILATGVVVALTSGGFALAATDRLPSLPDQASDQATESVAKNRATAAPTTTPTEPTETVTTPTETPTTGEPETPSPRDLSTSRMPSSA